MYSFKERALCVGVAVGNGVGVAVGTGITVGAAVGVASPPQVVANKAPTVSIRTLIEPILMPGIIAS